MSILLASVKLAGQVEERKLHMVLLLCGSLYIVYSEVKSKTQTGV